MEIKQPDGTAFTAHLGGDERFSWVSANGAIIKRGEGGYWRYVRLVNGNAVVSPLRVMIDPAPQDAATVKDAGLLHQADRQAPAPPGQSLPASEALSRAPSNATEPMLVLLVEFSDRTLTTTEAEWADKMFGTSGKTVRTYYDQVSRDTFHFSDAAESYGTANNGIVKVTLGYAHPNTGDDTGDANREIVRDALVAADPQVDYSAFDADSSGGLSTSELHVVTIVAGYERSYSANYTPNVWAHRWSLWGDVAPPQLDGVYVAGYSYGGGYTQQGELHGTHAATIGILCHELGHDIGLPDLYDTDDSNGDSEGIGDHGVMAGGSWGRESGEDSGTTPTLMCAWSRIDMGFITATEIDAPGIYYATQASDASSNVLKIATSDPNEYFLIENRQLTGFDAGLYGSFSTTSGGSAAGGLAIWHVDGSVGGNQDENHKKVDLEEANEGLVGHSELDDEVNRGNRHHYYYAEHVAAFDDTTVPNALLYDGTSAGIALSDVSSSGAVMSFQLGALSLDGPDLVVTYVLASPSTVDPAQAARSMPSSTIRATSLPLGSGAASTTKPREPSATSTLWSRAWPRAGTGSCRFSGTCSGPQAITR